MPHRRSCIEAGTPAPAAGGADRLAEVRRHRRAQERRADLLALLTLAALVLAVWVALPPPG